MKTWEYKIEREKTISTNEYLNKLGKKGWELVHFGDGLTKLFIFKRELK